jgi:raffinose/stachyose/melibiose transport system substrate-binding protein
VLVGLVALAAGPAAAPAKRADTVTISILRIVNSKPAWDVLIPNFERAYPNIKVDAAYTPSNTSMYQLEATELAAGNAPDLLSTDPGCGTPVAVCVLGRGGYLAPMVAKPWAKKRSLPLVTSENKHDGALVAFEPQVGFNGVFTNDSLFSKLGLKVPQTFSQLLDVCRKARAAGTSAVILAGGSGAPVSGLIEGLAVATVYGKDKHWNQKLKAGKVAFAGSSGWHLALRRFIDMNDAGCFQPGATGVTSGNTAAALFAQGRGLMLALTSINKGAIDAASPQFNYSFHRFPGGTSPTETTTYLSLAPEVSVNAHSSAGNQRAAQTFVDFIARPKQNALYTQVTGGLSQYEFLKGKIPDFMSSLRRVFAENKWVVSPHASWWNAATLKALQDNAIGLITGQRSIEDVLKAMDAAWKQGPA